MHRYKCYNAPMITTTAPAWVTTGTSIKTMLQIATPSTRMIQLISWGYSLDAAPTSAIGKIELVETDVAATVTAHSASGVQPIYPGLPASLMTLSTSGTGFTATVEGSTTTTRSFDNQIVPAIGQDPSNTWYEYQWMPDERPWVNVSKFLRVRATFGAAVNMLTWITWDE